MKRVRVWIKAKKILYGMLVVYLLGLIGFVVGFGIKGHKNESFKVIDAFHLETWFTSPARSTSTRVSCTC